ncbi:class A beta-lactamase-related serine hydrolase [Tissierella sp. MSJ-40]|uniref:Class A beta-lactamase-related serine hydrolase n=1 Tax=Tissierella simiarum TaxID=2841534 RepID=A0ABS6E820_9FIRM|nr:serine hydrolase [Tissierella simiarum]MBU5438580.1 class A beta-lactamase-related serine hydrolase [Tissierella simiarum]
METKLIDMLNSLEGEIGFYYKDLKTGKEIKYKEDEPLIAASIIKIPILIEILRQIEEGRLKKDQKVKVQREDKMPSCGALTYMHNGLEVTIEDLYTLMIIHSDNTATNMLIKISGMENINNTMKNLGLKKSKLNRLLFDSEEQKKGKENYITSFEMGILLEKMNSYRLISENISKEIDRVLKLQRLNHKIPYLIPNNIEIGHKTGEDSGITHDVGVVYSKNPFIFCFTSNKTNVIQAETILREMALICYENSTI